MALLVIRWQHAYHMRQVTVASVKQVSLEMGHHVQVYKFRLSMWYYFPFFKNSIHCELQ